MKTMKIKKDKPILVRMADQLLRDQQELDKLAVQFSLGKAEVKDKFEDAKKQMQKRINEFKEDLAADYKLAKEWVSELKPKLAELENQLNRGKAESKIHFQEQKKNILKRMDEVRFEIMKNPEVVKMAVLFTAALEKIKLQLELFEKKLDEGKQELTRDFKAEMYDALAKFNAINEAIKEKKEDVNVKLDHFNEEIHLAYAHLKKAIQAL